MTFVAAKRFGDRIIVASDTMISGPRGTANDVIPGRLKIVILSPYITVAFAGLRDQSIDAIRKAKQALIDCRPVFEIENILRLATIEYADCENAPEFIFISHLEGCFLKRIWEGRVSDTLDQTSIGDRHLMRKLLEKYNNHLLPIIPNIFEEERRFAMGFLDMFDGIYVSEGVGGFAITATCSATGHHYDSRFGVTAWDPVFGGKAITEQQLADRRSGMTQWGYSSHDPSCRGVGVVGCLLEDAGVGFIYTPLREDKPILWRFSKPSKPDQSGPIQKIFEGMIEAEADLIGGGVKFTSSGSTPRIPTFEEMKIISDYATKAKLPTKIELCDNGVWLFCGNSARWKRVLAGFYNLNPDPAYILTTAIDRINAQISIDLLRAGEPSGVQQ